MLKTFVLTLHHDAGGQVGNTDRRVGGVNVLPARAGGAEGIDAQIRRVDIRHFRLRQLRHHRHRTGGGVDTPLRLGGRHALHAMAAGFKFEPAVDAVAADLGDHLFKAAVFTFVGAEDLHLPAARFRVTGVHAEQIAGKQRRFVAAGPGAYFHEGVTLVIRIFRQEQDLQLLLQLFAFIFGVPQLFLRHFAHFRIVEHHLCGFNILLHLTPVGIAARHIAQLSILRDSARNLS